MNYRFSRGAERIGTSAIREILKAAQARNTISFAGGLPAEDLFPVQLLRQAYHTAFAESPRILQYAPTEGLLSLRELIACHLAERGMTVSPDQIQLTTGSQQVIDLAVKILVDPGDAILVENPTYLAALQVFQLHGATVIAVPTDADGPLPDVLQRLLDNHNPRLFYANPTYANPTGSVWSLERRKAVIELCHTSGTVILEDDPYGMLKYDEDPPIPSLLALDPPDNDGITLYAGTFSKTVAPGMRVGWAAGPTPIIRQLTRAKQAADLQSSYIEQAALTNLLATFSLDDHVRQLRKVYGERRDTMVRELRSLDSVAPLHFQTPRGGMFVWVEAPPEVNTAELLPVAVERGVAFVPGAPFYVSDVATNTMRLNFSHSSPDVIVRGVQFLGDALREFMAGAR
jgi:2-aminoadipate transaminase